MLTNLRIQNFALIDSISIDFKAGFTVLTGETGSGKSILLGALNLILGERADYSVIGPNGEKSIVEAEFQLSNFHLNAFFQENDIDDYETTIIRREITSQGRSRAFINDTPIQLAVLKEFAEKLIHIHSQHHTLELKNTNFQIELLDTLADLNSEKNDYFKKFKTWNESSKKLNQLKEELSKAIQVADYNRFQLEELEELSLESKNYEALELELNKSESVDEIKSTLDHIHLAIDGDEGVLSVLNKLKISTDRLKDKDEVINELATRVQSVVIELKDIVAEAEDQKEKIEINPFRINELTAALDKYNRVLKKHGFVTQAQLIEYKDTISNDLVSSDELQDEIAQLSVQTEKLALEIGEIANKIHEKRKKAAPSIEESIQLLLADLKMPNTRIQFQLSERKELNANGISDVAILFSPNKGIEPIAIDKAASGGELSRLMLALQNLVSKKKQLPTIIFDEIDTGVSGDVAQKIGNLLRNMGENLQLLAITHLPQVAGKAQNHFKVEKAIVNNLTRTNVRVLSDVERVEEIARLMSGEEINEAALLNAKALMN
jgi:DNA repair protein RecN (Recombination protein N)